MTTPAIAAAGKSAAGSKIGGVVGSAANSAASSAGGGFFSTPGADPGGWLFGQVQGIRRRKEAEEAMRQQMELERMRMALVQQQAGALRDERSDKRMFRNAMLGII